jgi:DNA (cytosine-5)-methyltransferase 1
VFLVGLHSDLNLEYSFPLATHCQDALLHDQWVSGDYWERHGVSKQKRPSPPPTLTKRIGRLKGELREFMLPPWRTVRDAIGDLPELAVGESSSAFANHYVHPGAKSYPGHTASPWDEPAKALKAGDHGVPGGENMLRLDGREVRYFSARECGRLQCFPDEWRFEGAWTETMRQLGNAVPVKLAEQIARPLVSMLKATRVVASRSRRG